MSSTIGGLTRGPQLCHDREPEHEHPIEEYSRGRQLQVHGHPVFLELVRWQFELHADAGRRAQLGQALRRSEACVLVYDVTDRESFACAEQLYRLLCEARPPPPPPPHGDVGGASRSRSRAFLDRLLGRRAPVQDSAPEMEPPVPLFVVANKTDKPRATWAVTAEEGVRFSQRTGAVFYAVSALAGDGCGKEMVDEIGERVFQRRMMARGDSVSGA